MGLLCEDQLADKLVGLFREAADQSYIDDAVAQAKRRLEDENKRVKRADLEKLFDGQIQTLKDRGCLAAIVEMFQNQRKAVITKAGQISFEKGRIPFLPVIPRTYLTIFSQMPMVRFKDKVGYALLDPTETTDVVETPTKPYYMFDVEDGMAMLKLAPQDAENVIKKQGRSCVTDVESISIGVHTDVLSRHCVDATGSRVKSGRVPRLYLNGGRPERGWSCLRSACSGWGSASCGSRA